MNGTTYELIASRTRFSGVQQWRADHNTFRKVTLTVTNTLTRKPSGAEWPRIRYQRYRNHTFTSQCGQIYGALFRQDNTDAGDFHYVEVSSSYFTIVMLDLET